MKKTSRQRANDMAEAQSIFANATPNVQEMIRVRLAIEFGALCGVKFRLRETLGTEPHPALVTKELKRVLGW